MVSYQNYNYSLILHYTYPAAVIRSLKALQEKIRTLEMERVAASEHFKTLSQNVGTSFPHVATTSVGTGTDSVTSSDLILKDTTTSRPREDWRGSRGVSCSGDGDTSGLKSRLDSLDKRLSQQAQELDTMHQKLRLSDAHRPHSPHMAHTPHTTHSSHTAHSPLSPQPPVCPKVCIYAQNCYNRFVLHHMYTE